MRRHFFIWLFALMALAFGVLGVSAPKETKEQKNSILVVYNHEASVRDNGLLKRPGFSAYVRLGNRSLLFDTGGEASVIYENLQRLSINSALLDAVVISHNHWDHVYGLPGVLTEANANIPVYVPALAAESIKKQFPRATVMAVKEPKEIFPGAWVTKPLGTKFKGVSLSEQVLVLNTKDGLHIIAGCSHPGIVAFVELAKQMFPDKNIALVAGGFHLRSKGEAEINKIADKLKSLGVQRVGPSHCSGDQAKRIFRKRWGAKYVNFDLGDTYRF